MKTLLSAWLIAALVVCVSRAETGSDNPPLVSFGAFPLPLKRTYVSANSGRPAKKAKLDDPFPDDFPPSTTVMLEDTRDFPSGEGRYYFPSRNILRVYNISHVKTASYETIQGEMQRLRKLLAERPRMIPDDGQHSTPLPDYPPRNAAHVFEVKLTYVDAAWGSGIGYVTQFTQDEDSSANNEELTYIFQGISKDNHFYVSADFSIKHPTLPNRVQDIPERAKRESASEGSLLAKQTDPSFAPSLAKIRKWISSLKIE